ncbi:unnamed protein product [Orchesella dallaii]|uniref:Peptidase S1 domain-containing protein n=1 Tax=Orchesella dallaii TaxID=48710 RepID=A0ABP1R2E5_9HEXA
MQWFHRLNVLFIVSVTTIYFVTLLCPGSALPKKKWIDQIAMESEVPAAEDSKSKPGVGLSAEEMMQVSVLPSSPGASYGGYKINPNCRCGISNSEDGNQHPWTAAIFYKYRESPDPDAKSTMILFCTGTLINDRWVLTASRCVQGLNATDLQVWLSEKPVWSDQATKEDQTLKKTVVDNIIIHPDFDPSTLNHEIALLRLADPVRLSAPPTPPILSEEVDVSENLDDVDRKPKKNEEESQSQSETAPQLQFFTPVCLPKYDVIDDSMQKTVIQKKENEKERETEQNDDANENDNENAYISSIKGTVVSWEKKGRTSYSLVENKVPFVNGITKCLEMIQRHSNSSVNLNDNMLCAGDMEHDVKDSCAVNVNFKNLLNLKVF